MLKKTPTNWVSSFCCWWNLSMRVCESLSHHIGEPAPVGPEPLPVLVHLGGPGIATGLATLNFFFFYFFTYFLIFFVILFTRSERRKNNDNANFVILLIIRMCSFIKQSTIVIKNAWRREGCIIVHGLVWWRIGLGSFALFTYSPQNRIGQHTVD